MRFFSVVFIIALCMIYLFGVDQIEAQETLKYHLFTCKLNSLNDNLNFQFQGEVLESGSYQTSAHVYVIRNERRLWEVESIEIKYSISKFDPGGLGGTGVPKGFIRWIVASFFHDQDVKINMEMPFQNGILTNSIEHSRLELPAEQSVECRLIP